MSIRLMSKTWELDLPTNEKMLLLALCDHANDDGVCYPSYDKLQIKCSFARATVSANLKRLEAKNLVKKVLRNQAEGGRKTTIYTIDLVAQSSTAELTPQSSTAEPQKVAQSSTAEPKPSVYLLNHHLYKELSQKEESLYLEYISLRKLLKIQTTNSIHNRLLEKYFRFGRNQQVIENAINSNWKDFFEPKKQTFKGKEPEVGSYAWRMQQQQNEIDVEVIDEVNT